MANASLPKTLNVISWVMQGIVAIIFLAMGALPKLTGDPYAVQIFEQVGLGDAGRYATGVAELIAGALILIPKTNWIGAALGALVMLGALGSHLTKLGVVVKFTNPDTGAIESNPMLFPIALLLLGLCLGVFSLRKLHPGSMADAGASDRASAGANPEPDNEPAAE